MVRFTAFQIVVYLCGFYLYRVGNDLCVVPLSCRFRHCLIIMQNSHISGFYPVGAGFYSARYTNIRQMPNREEQSPSPTGIANISTKSDDLYNGTTQQNASILGRSLQSIRHNRTTNPNLKEFDRLRLWRSNGADRENKSYGLTRNNYANLPARASGHPGSELNLHSVI